MAVMRKSELLELGIEDMEAKLAEVEEELRTEHGTRKTTGRPSNIGRFKELRRLKARIKTLLRQRGVKL